MQYHVILLLCPTFQKRTICTLEVLGPSRPQHLGGLLDFVLTALQPKILKVLKIWSLCHQQISSNSFCNPDIPRNTEIQKKEQENLNFENLEGPQNISRFSTNGSPFCFDMSLVEIYFRIITFIQVNVGSQ